VPLAFTLPFALAKSAIARATPAALALRAMNTLLSDRIGETLGTSGWIEVAQARIDAFADCTGDHNRIHIDRAYAAAGPFGGTIAHGFLTLSLLARMAQDALPDHLIERALNYGVEHLRFVAPVRSGVRVRGRFDLASVTPHAHDLQLVAVAVTVEIEGGDKPALVGTWILAIPA